MSISYYNKFCFLKENLMYNLYFFITFSVKRGGGYSALKSLERTPRFTFLENNSLEIGPVLTSDEGWYSCTAFSQGRYLRKNNSAHFHWALHI